DREQHRKGARTEHEVHRDERGLGCETPRERRQAPEPIQRRHGQHRNGERMIDEVEKDGEDDRTADRAADADLVGLRAPLRPEAVAHADHLDRRLALRAYVGAFRLLAHPPSGVRSPRSPSGRKIRIRIENTIDSVQSEPGMCHGRPSFQAWMSPIVTAPSTAPGRFPIPPSTAAVNEIRPSWKPWSKRTVVAQRAYSVPAAPASAPAITNVNEIVRFTLM